MNVEKNKVMRCSREEGLRNLRLGLNGVELELVS